MIVVRYADDTIVGFQHEHEARTFLDELKERIGKFELALHPDKTRLTRFGRHAAKQREKLGEGKPETFDFLGFTHFCTRSRKWGSSGARRSRSVCEQGCWPSRQSFAVECTTLSRIPVPGSNGCCKGI
jgi:hypothetical protein